MKITFLLPGEGTFPGGGAKVVYEYANALARRGHYVTVVHPAFLNPAKMNPPYLAKRTIRYMQRSIDKSYRPDLWFAVDSHVRLLWKPSLNSRHIPDADVVVATSWLTAEYVAGYPHGKGNKFYLVQDLETWDGLEERVMRTWNLPLNKVVISRWLYKIAADMGETAIYIPNGLNFEAFGIDIDPVKRPSTHLMMLYHEGTRKGFADGIAAVRLAREQVTSIQLNLFGVSEAPGGLPEWIRYHRKPRQSTLRELYNRSAVFLTPSRSEGWGLPASEAMQCGCAVVATDIGGHREFCLHDQTALLSPPKDPEGMARNIVDLLENQEKRLRISRAGHENIQQFTWKRAADALEHAFAERLETRIHV